MADIQIEIEGPAAVAATEELLNISGVSGDWSPAVEGSQREGVLITIATIVAITTGTITIAEKIYEWYQKSRRAQPSPAKQPRFSQVNPAQAVLQQVTS